jgi:hypothetical protein
LKILDNFLDGSAFARGVVGLFILLGASLAPAADGWSTEPAVLLHLRCTNPVGGANWAVVVDLGRGLVDSRPATITDSSIKWRDPAGGVYELDRSSLKLQLRGASSTGGYFLHYTCRPE